MGCGDYLSALVRVKAGLITKGAFNSGVGGSPEMSEKWKRTSCHRFSDMSPLVVTGLNFKVS